MKASKQWLQDNPQREVLKFNDFKPHTVTLKADKDEIYKPKDGSPARSGVRYLVIENGSEKEVFTSARDLIAQMARFNPGDTVTITATKDYGNGGEFTTYTVTSVNEGDPLNVDDEPNGEEVFPDGSIIPDEEQG